MSVCQHLSILIKYFALDPISQSPERYYIINQNTSSNAMLLGLSDVHFSTLL